MPLDMNPEIRAQWCAALRSGEYQQGEGQLRSGVGYCCLGVLSELAVKAGATSPAVYDQDHEWWTYDGRNDYLPDSVLEWSGLHDTNPEVQFRGERTWLAEINDRPCSFEEIADLIDGGVTL